MQQFLTLTINGVVQGTIFAAFALALVLIWRSTRIVNFAQAPMAMLTTYLALTVLDAGLPWWLAFVSALLGGLVLGALTERLIVRFVEDKEEINAVILTLGLFIAFTALAAVLFGSDYRSFPTGPFGVSGFRAGGVIIALTQFQMFTIVSVLVVLGALVALFRFTDIGLRMRAAAFSQEVSRLLGVRVGAMLTLGWALAALVGSLAGSLIAGGGLVYPHYMDGVVVFGFVAAVLGGLDSPLGAVVGGMILGLSLNYVGGFLNDSYLALTALLILIAVLMLKPGGLFSTATARRV